MNSTEELKKYKIITRSFEAELITNDDGVRAIIKLLQSLSKEDKVEVYMMNGKEFHLVESVHLPKILAT
ncbi:MAG: hypothetical protein V4549_07700 [Bacteroidota bacterium]